MRKPRLSLFQQVFLLSLVNIVLLGVLLLGVAQIRVFVPPDSPLSGAFRERLNLVPLTVGHLLSQNPKNNWDSMMRAQAARFGVDMYVLNTQGELMAGSDGNVPPAVRRAGGKFLRDEAKSPVVRREGGRRELMPPPTMSFSNPLMPAENAMFMETSNPTRYWGGMPIMVMDKTGPQIGMLLVSSESISGRGLFFDPRPWVLGLALIVLVSIVLWWPMVQRITRPLRQVTGAAEKIAKGDFMLKLPVNRGDEIGRLCRAINEMSVQLEALVRGQKRFLSHVAHELTSPAARIQMGLGVLENEVNEAAQPDLRMVMEEAQAMSRLLDELLCFARSEHLREKADLREARLLPLAQTARDQEAQPGGRMELEISPELYVLADPGLLMRALGNLLRNAIRHAGIDCPMGIRARQRGGMVEIVVWDEGPGAPEQDLPRLLEPFQKIESGRVGKAGVGLGLSIVKSCIESCRGRVVCRNRGQGGFEVVINLPGGSRPL